MTTPNFSIDVVTRGTGPDITSEVCLCSLKRQQWLRIDCVTEGDAEDLAKAIQAAINAYSTEYVSEVRS